jgi:hypothetical protein
MKKNNRYTVPLVTISVIAIASMMISGFLKAATQGDDLVSQKVISAPRLDGSGSDAVWKNAPEFKVQAKDGPELSFRSVYTSDRVYMLISWLDETESVKKKMWRYDGEKWATLKEQRVYEPKPTNSDEDRLSIHWSINDSIKSFAEKGCLVLCHDKILTATQEPDLHERREAAHHGDAKGEGNLNYADNKTDDGKPKFMHRDSTGSSYFLKKEDVILIDYLKATFKKGDTIPGYVLARPKGSRGDVDAQGVWKDGRWTLEIGRRLVTTDKGHDVQFDDLKKTYYFGIAVFDNDGSNVHTLNPAMAML